MSTLGIAAHNFFGLIEMDRAGTVLYSRLDGEAPRASEADIRGSNYYAEVAPFENVEELRERLGEFEKNGHPAESFMFDCRFRDGGVVTVRVLLARMRQRADSAPAESVLMHIKKV